MPEARPTLVYDGDCGICRTWVSYWQALTGERVVYRAYQDVAADFPAIPAAAFERAIQLIEPDGHVHSGAAATFRVLRHAPGRALGWWLYAHLPGFAAVSEAVYAFFARHRGLLVGSPGCCGGARSRRRATNSRARCSCACSAPSMSPHSGRSRCRSSVSWATTGSCRSPTYLDAAREALGASAYWLLPTLFWLHARDTALVAGAAVGVLLGMLVIVDRWTRPALIGLFVLYLSYIYAGQDFMHFQWDALLLEAGFLAIFLTGGSRIVVWLYRWLVFRYLFLAGAVKLALRRPDVARSDRARLSLLDAAAADAARVVRRAAAARAARGRNRRDARGRARVTVPHLRCRAVRGRSRRGA